jgi:rhamnosyltransferase
VKVSVVILTWNGEDTVEECLHGVFSQKRDFELDVVMIDSSSTDRTLEIAARFPARVRVIDQRDFDHGDTRNMGAWLTDGELIVFLVQDAFPLRTDWLATLVRNFEDERVGGVFCRILPRPTAGPLVRRAGGRPLRTARTD